jgi:hypothetical protein
MGCSACLAAQKQSQNMVSPEYRISTNSSEPCDYTINTIKVWLEKVNCFKNKGLYVNYTLFPKKKLNAYIGILLSALNHSSNICYFKNQLSEIETFILFISTIQECQTT